MAKFLKTKEVYLPPAELLPEGFKFPQAFLDFVHQPQIPDLDPWFFMCYYPDYYLSWIGILKTQYPDRQLIPFAKFGLNDDVACFEPGEDPEQPVIHYIHSFTDPGYEERGWVPTFEAWLENALEEAAEYQAEFDDEDEDEDEEEEE